MLNTSFTIKALKESNTYGLFVIGPLDSGYGYTLGHSLKRTLLTSIAGAAITSVKINGVAHKFSTVPGLKENVVDLLLNLKELSVHFTGSKKSATLRLSVKGPKEITGKDVEVSDGVEIANQDQYIGYLSDKKLEMEMTVEEGFGYTLAEETSSEELGVITTDAIFSPVKRVDYKVANTRVGRQTNLDEVTLEVWTNGSVTPRDALESAARTLAQYFIQMYNPSEEALSDAPVKVATGSDAAGISIDELDLPTRISNSLKNGGIENVAELLKTPKKELASMRNMGAKSITVIEEKLAEKGISFPA